MRAVNVGRHNRVQMADVRAAVAALGYSDVRTYLPTGNLALETGEPAETVASRIEAALVGLGLHDVDAMVRSRADLDVLDGCVFDPYPSDAHRHLAIFTRQPVEIAQPLPLALAGVTFVAGGSALLAVIPRETPRPVNANAVVESTWKTRATTRWWNVVEDFRRNVLG